MQGNLCSELVVNFIYHLCGSALFLGVASLSAVPIEGGGPPDSALIH